MNACAPQIAGLLTTYNRACLLPLILDGLLQQDLPQESYEIVIVNDGSSDQTRETLDYYSKSRTNIRVIHQYHSGLACARNLAVIASRAPLIVFLDDDDIASPNLLSAHLAAHKRYPAPNVAILGFTRLDEKIALIPLMHHVTEVGCQLFSYGRMKPGAMLTFREFWGGRSSCKREFLLTHGLFNPAFKFGCEDMELGWRLHKFGLQVVYEPAAISTMIRAISFDDFCRRSYRQGLSQAKFYDLHREQEINVYCEIDDALSLWPGARIIFKRLVDHVRRLDNYARDGSLPREGIPCDLTKALHDGYRSAFSLFRAKGINDEMARLNVNGNPKPSTHRHCSGRLA
jgi:glycosyltransferase involved in cell wall biosynthesis